MRIDHICFGAPRAASAAGAPQDAEAAGEQEAPAAPRLSEERIARIRERIRSGVYDSAEVAGEVARRMLARGDV